MAIQKAGAYCESINRQILVTNIEYGGERADVTFQCLPTGDARLQQPGGNSPSINVNLNTRS